MIVQGLDPTTLIAECPVHLARKDECRPLPGKCRETEGKRERERRQEETDMRENILRITFLSPADLEIRWLETTNGDWIEKCVSPSFKKVNC